MQSDSFNELNPAQVERLALLAEECAEVIQIVGKILRHGYESTHPDNPDGDTNREMLETELGHVQFTISLLSSKKDLSFGNVISSKHTKKATFHLFAHHN